MIRFRMSDTASVVAVGLAWLLPLHSAKADLLFGVSASTSTTSSFAQPGCGINPSYTTAAGGSVSQSTGASGCSISSSVPVVSGLTSVTVQGSASSKNFGDNSTIHTSASSKSDLTTASLHATASAPVAAPAPPQAAASAGWLDTLTFNIAGATATTVTVIPMTFSVDGIAIGGSVNGAGTGVPSGPATELNVNAAVQILAGANSCIASQGIGCSGAVGEAEWSSDTVAQHGVQDSTFGSTTWNAATINTLTNFTAEGSLSITGTQGVFNVAAALNLDAAIGSLDYSDTAGLTFDLPSGVTLSSASGVFDVNAAIPEPSSLTLLGSTLFGIGLGWKRRGHHKSALNGPAALPGRFK